jgi:hypothetical protein
MSELSTVDAYQEMAARVGSLIDITEDLEERASTPGEHVLPKGTFRVSRTIGLSDDCHIAGFGNMETTLVLADGVNNNMFTNSGYRQEAPNNNIKVSNLRINGNQDKQRKPADEKRLSFCNAFYMANVTNCAFEDIVIENVKQTSLHFRRCTTVRIDRFKSQGLGWSGISTSGTDDLEATDFYIYDSGNDHRHSAVHLDGGKGAYLHGEVKKCVGNGIMLDSSFAPFSHALVQVNSEQCMRGISLIGSGEVQVHSVLLSDCQVADNDIGIMLSNAHSSFVSKCRITSSNEVGLLLQGRAGGFDNTVSDCMFFDNARDMEERHQSRDNRFIGNQWEV